MSAFAPVARDGTGAVRAQTRPTQPDKIALRKHKTQPRRQLLLFERRGSKRQQLNLRNNCADVVRNDATPQLRRCLGQRADG